MKVTSTWPSQLKGPVIHLTFTSQEEACGTMVRMQEFYESPLPGIRGNVFTHAEYMEANKRANGGKYDYDWNGFNIPGNVVRDFFARFAPLSGNERAIKEHAIPPTGDFYLIATHADDKDVDVVQHEVCHAFFYLSDKYRDGMTKLVEKFAAEKPDAHAYLRGWLLARGYDESVVVDEMQAYLATTPREWWTESEQGVSDFMATRLWDAGHLFRAMVQE